MVVLAVLVAAARAGVVPARRPGRLVIYAAIRLIDVAEIAADRPVPPQRAACSLAATTVGVLLSACCAGSPWRSALSVLDLLRRVARGRTTGSSGIVPGMAGMHDVDDYPEAAPSQGLVVYRYDSPLFFANAEDFRTRCLAAVGDDPARPVEWLAGQHGGQRRGRHHRRSTRWRRSATSSPPRASWSRWPGSRQDLRDDLDRTG